MRVVHIVAFLLVIIGAINWGLIGLFRLNLVEGLVDFIPGLLTFTYILIGISAIYIGVTHVRQCRECLQRVKK